ncbi:hypothetical protein KH5H1_74570 [Corallococcus caeni]|uniref:Uncharacterized protein n=2 Tax=Corallococcus TaxID=83461 RepID=A0A7Y4JTW3_9BACT|nr:hypothetical protein [Corallococcus exercitus]NOK11089.1 hypothetical protein [Corallococcus exercitus]GMU03335.1 hypothetical protein KH5H1_74570 [Corallococcus sp. KH5-1]GMU10190.1 hypothetical protein ASNO1_64440 [Corallococcus sp. NO1]
MPDPFALSGRVALQRTALPEVTLSATPDASDAKAAALDNLAGTRAKLDLDAVVLKALEVRISRLPPVPAVPVTLQDLVRAARRKLIAERQREVGVWVDTRVKLAMRLVQKLEE